MINSNNTQKNSDYDFTKLWKWALGNKGGIENRNQFTFDTSSKTLSAGNGIASAYILCTRPTSNPIPNEQFLAQFEFTGSLNFLNITNGDKIFIEIKENLVNDPTLIEDLDTQTNYSQGLGIGEIKMAREYPNHTNYLKLYEWNNWLVDKREIISIPELDSVAQRTSTLEQKMKSAESNISVLQDKGTPQYLGKFVEVGEAYQDGDVMVEKWGKLVRELYKQYHSGIRELWIAHNSPSQDLGKSVVPAGSTVKIKLKQVYNSGNSYEGGRFKVGTQAWSSDIGRTSFDPNRKDVEFSYFMGEKTEIYFSIEGISNRITAQIESIEVEVNKNSNLPKLYPREIKQVDERVECTLIGLHSDDHNIIPELKKSVVMAKVEGTAKSVWNSPKSGWCEVSRDCRGSGSVCKFNGENLVWTWKKQIFIQEGLIPLETFINLWGVASITIESFITVTQ